MGKGNALHGEGQKGEGGDGVEGSYFFFLFTWEANSLSPGDHLPGLFSSTCVQTQLRETHGVSKQQEHLPGRF